MPFFVFFSLFFLLTSPRSAVAIERTQLCEITIEGEEEIKFSSTEKKWLCGTSKIDGWSQIPLNQKALFLKSFLQSRGYHKSEINLSVEGVKVLLGPKSYLQELEVFSAPPSWHWQKRRYIKNRPFTTKTLDEFDQWAKRRLQENAYPCPKISSQAIVDESKFEIYALLGDPETFHDIQTVGESELDPAILDRYSAFFPGDPFDIRLLEITSNRVLKEDLYLSTYYDIICPPNGNSINSADGALNSNEDTRRSNTSTKSNSNHRHAILIRRMIPAKPKLLSMGVGYDTESGALFKATFKQTRLNSMADNLSVSLFASMIEQNLNFKHRHYFTSDLRSRLHLLTDVLVKRESENSYETNTYQLAEYLSYGWEHRDYNATISAGPVLERTDTVRGENTGKIDALKIYGDLQLTSHLYEFYQTNPQEGWTVSLNASSQIEGAISQQTFHRVSLRHQILWNLDGWDPALFILGWRGWAGSYFLSTGQSESAEIPTNQRFFLGGDADIRGFGRKQLPDNDFGYLTVIYQGLELRAGDLLPYHLQPFIFTDFAQGGMFAAELDQTIFYDVGLGVRWASPLGTVRGSLGKGFIANSDNDIAPDYQFFFSYGREF